MKKKIIKGKTIQHATVTSGTLFLVLLITLSPINGQAKDKKVKDSKKPAKTELGIKGTQFTINSTPTFLYGISYYGALGAPENFILSDLADMNSYGFNWIRVWATWNNFGDNVSAVDVDGNPREPYFSKLKWLVAECDRKGIIVDVTLHRNSGDVNPSLPNLASHQRAVETIVTLLRPYNNWYMDLANEFEVRDTRFVSLEELKQLLKTAKHLDPKLLVTASGGVKNRDVMREFLHTVHVDFVCPHGRRFPGSPEQTEARTREFYSWMKGLGQRKVPVHFQEPFRRGYNNWQPLAADFMTDMLNAKAGGAAGWCFHNGSQKDQADKNPRRSFDMREKRLFDQMDTEELIAIENIRDID